MEREAVEAAIRTAFAGVQLGSGVSLHQAKAADDYGRGYTLAEFQALKRSEVTDDWAAVPEDEVRTAMVAHLDADGLRYYLPPLMLWLFGHYDDEDKWRDDTDMTVIGTIGALAPTKEFRAYRYAMFDTFTEQQRAAIASYLDALPGLVHLDREDATLVERAMRDYWRRFIPTSG